jgi:hypothetical protein
MLLPSALRLMDPGVRVKILVLTGSVGVAAGLCPFPGGRSEVSGAAPSHGLVGMVSCLPSRAPRGIGRLASVAEGLGLGDGSRFSAGAANRR